MTIRQPIKDLGKSTAVYGFGNILTKLASFLLIPIYTRYLELTEVGILALLEMFEALLISLVPAAINNALWRYLPEHGEEGRRKLVISVFVWATIGYAVLLIVLSLGRSVAITFLGLSPAESPIVMLVLLNIFLAFGSRFLLGLWQYDQKQVSFIVLSFIQFAGVLIVTLVLVVGQGMGLQGVVLAKTTVYVVTFFVSAVVILRQNFTWPSFRPFMRIVRFGAPLILVTLVAPVLTVSDRFFLKLFVSIDDIGIYSIGYRFGMIINMILIMPLQRGWRPMMYRLGIDEASHEYHRDILFYFAVLGSMIFLGISLFARDIIGVVATEAYLAGALIVPLVTLAYFANGFGHFFIAGAALTDKTAHLAPVSLIAILANLVLNFVLIGQFKIQGAAWATFLSYFLFSALILRSSQKSVKIQWDWGRLAKLILILFILYQGTLYLQAEIPEWRVALAFAALVFFPIALKITRTLGWRELNGFKLLARQLFSFLSSARKGD